VAVTSDPAERPTKIGLRPETVVRSGLEILDEQGVDGVSVRSIATRLGVRMNTVLWHVKSKARLLDLMADAIIGEVLVDGLPERPEDRARELASRFRHALLAHRDGAAVVAGTYAPERSTLRVAEAMVEALLSSGLDEREASWTCWTIVYFSLGLVQEEQAFPVAGRPVSQALVPGDHPSLTRVVRHMWDGSFDERFDFGLSLILRPPGAADPVG
jgi:AcrR family transcriptional regulator